MKKQALLFILASFLVFTARIASAQWNSGSTYDWRSGNSYNWNQGVDGSTNVHGFNLQNGTQWNTTIQPNRDMHGFDGNNNYWTYHQGTGMYQNLGTGRMCVGHGYARQCF